MKARLKPWLAGLKPRRRPGFRGLLEELEPRLLLNADLAVPLEAGAVVSAAPLPLVVAAGTATPGTGGQWQQTQTPTAEAISASAVELVIVDRSVPEAETLVSQLQAQAAQSGRVIELHWLETDADGVSQISAILQGRQDIAALHLISHGGDGALQLGHATIDSANLMQHAQALTSWQASLSADADILIYGCDVAATEVGQRFVDDLALLTGADVAASTDLTGASSLGGDWLLEYKAGAVEATTVVATLDNWAQVLATVTLRDGLNGYTGTTDTFLQTSMGVAQNDNNSADTTLLAGEDGTGGQAQLLLRFDNLVGTGPNQIPPGSTITSVTLTVYVTSKPTFTSPSFGIHRMLVPWQDTATWSSMGEGITTFFPSEARAATDQSITASSTGAKTFASNPAMVATVQAWVDNPSSNYGWYTDNGDYSSRTSFASAENGTVANRPTLVVNYTAPTPTITSNGGGATASISVGENQTAVTTVTSSAGMAALVYSITGGADAAQFNIDSSTGVLTFKVAPNFEAPSDAGLNNVYDVVVSVSDGTTTDSQAIAVTVTNVNDIAPVLGMTGTVLNYAENAGPVAVDSGLTLSDADSTQLSGATVQIASNYVNGEDLLSFTSQNGITASWNALTGLLTLSGSASLAQYQTALRSVTYTNSSDNPSSAQRTVNVVLNDTGLSSNTGTRTIAVTPVNDAPAAAITPTSYTATEQQPLTLHGTGLSVSDADATSAAVQVTLAVTNGQLTVVAGSTGVTVSNSGTATVTLLGTVAQINSLLAGSGAGAVSYLHPSDTPATSSTLTLTINDLGNSGSGTALSASDTATINITPVNDAPSATIVPTSYAATEQTALVLHGTGLSVADVDAGSAMVQATLSVTAGSLTATAGTTGVTVSNSGTGTVTLSGTVAQINNLLAGNGGSTLTYLNASDAPGATATLTLSLSDLGNTGSGGALTGSDTAVISIAAVNDGPTATITPTTYSATEQAVLTLHGTGLSVSDPDAASSVVQVTLSVTSGALTVGTGTTGVTVSNSGTASVTLSGTLAQINTLLAGTSGGTVTFLNSSDTPQATATLTLSINDQGNTGSGGALTGSDTAVINVAAVNDAPTATITPTTYAATEQTALSLQGTGLSVSDPDAGNAAVSATLSVTSGALTVNAGTTGVTVGNSGTGSVTLSGTLAQINALLAGSGGAAITYLNASDAPAATATLTLSINDQGNTGTGGARSGSDTATISINAVNDAPVATITPVAYTAIEQTSLAIHGTGLSVSDPDSAGAVVVATLSVISGTLTASAGTTGVVISGSGSTTLTLTGTIAQINALLAGNNSGAVHYLISTDSPPATDTLSLTLNDQGNTGSGGALTGTDSALINITPVNDAPSAAIIPASYSTSEQVPLTLHGTGLSVADADAGTNTVVVTLSVVSGTLSALAGSTGALVGGSGSSTLTLTGSLTSINALLAGNGGATLSYVNNSDAPPPSDTLTLAINDQGHSGPGGGLTASDTASITLTSTNDPPVVITNLGLTANQGTASTLTTSRLRTADADHTAAQLTYTLTSTPTSGTLSRAGVALTAGGTFTQADVDNGLVIYTHDGSANTSDQFGFTVSDPLGSTVGPATVAISVNITNTSPTLATNTGANVVEGGSVVIGPAALSTQDAESLPQEVTYTVTAAPAHGQLTLSGVALGDGDTFSQQDIIDGLLTYTHDGTETLADTFTFVVDDGQGGVVGSTGFNITVTAQNDAPTVTAGSGTVPEGGLVVVGPSLIQVNDTDHSTGSLVITLQAAPSHGVLTLRGVALAVGDTFTQADLNAGDVVYQHAGGENANDQWSVLVSDGTLSSAPAAVNLTVAAVNDAPVATVPGTGYTATENAVLALHGTGLSVGDVDAGGSLVQVTLSVGAGTLSVVAGSTGVSIAGSGSGTLTLTGTVSQVNALLAGVGGASVSYVMDSATPPPSDLLILAVNDLGHNGSGGAMSSSATVGIGIVAVNDTPTVIITSPAYGATEQVPLTLHGTGLAIGDADAGSAVLNLALTVTHGVLNATAGSTGVSISGSGTGALVISGSTAQINALLSGLSGAGLTYVIGADNPAAADLLTLSVDDGGHSGSGGAQIAQASVGITVTAINDEPSVSAPVSYTAIEQVGLNLHGSGLSIADPDADLTQVTTTVSVISGLLQAYAGSTGVSITGSGTNAVTLVGTAAQINTLLAGGLGSSLVYTAQGDAPAATDTLTLNVDDEGGQGTGGPRSAQATVVIGITAVNDAPSITVPSVPVQATEQVPAALQGIGLSVADADATGPISLTLSVVSGQLTIVAGTTGVTVSGSGSASVTLAGTVAELNALLNGNSGASIQYLMDSDAPPVADTLTLRLDDLGQSGQGGALSEQKTLGIAITAVADAPAVGVTTASYAATEQVPLALQGTGLSISHGDAGNRTVIVRVSVTQGQLSATAGSTGVSLSGSGTGTITLAGTVAQINALLAGSGGATLTHLITSDNPAASSMLTLSLAEQASPAVPLASGSANVVVTAVNDAPSATIVPTSYTAVEQLPLSLHGTGLSIADPDAAGQILSATLAVSFGTLTVSPGLTGVAISGSGSASITLTGQVSQINALLAGQSSSSLVYLAAADAPPAGDTLTLTVNDLGQQGAGGGATGSDSALISITPVNDAPVVTVATPTYLATEQVVLALHGTGLSVSDVDAGSGSVRVTLSVISGTLTVQTGTTGATASGSGSSAVVLTGQVSQINALLAGLAQGRVSYLMDSDTPPPMDSLTLHIDDQGLSGQGGPQSSSATAAIAIGAVSDPPVATADQVRTLRNTPVSVTPQWLTANDWSPEGRALSVTMVQGPTTGALIAQPDGSWRYVPAEGFVGRDSIFYRVTDSTGEQSEVVMVTLLVEAPAPGPLQPLPAVPPQSGPVPVTVPAPATPLTPPDLETAVPDAPGPENEPTPAPALDPAPDLLDPAPPSAGPHQVLVPAQTSASGPDHPAAPGMLPAGWMIGAGAAGASDDQSLRTLLLQIAQEDAVPGDRLLQAVQVTLGEYEHLIDRAFSASLQGRPAETHEVALTPENIKVATSLLTVGAVWWAARGAGLVGSLLITTPVWRSIDPLPVLARLPGERREDQTQPGDDSRGDSEGDWHAESMFDARAPMPAEDIA